MKEFSDLFALYHYASAYHGNLISVMEYVDILKIFPLVKDLEIYKQMHVPFITHDVGNVGLIDAGALRYHSTEKGAGSSVYYLYHHIHIKMPDGTYRPTERLLKSTFENVMLQGKKCEVWVKGEEVLI